ncbi:MAG: Nucleotide modification associated domain 5, partial [Pseudomonadota bacterium]
TNSIEKSVTAALANIHSDTKLLKVWPEAAELLPNEIQKVQLPALPTADLNALIGLPSEKVAA